MKRFLPFACLLAAGCATVSPAPPPPDPETQMPALANRIAALVEEEREKLDPRAKALVFDPELAKIAQTRARDMAAKNYLAHVAPNGDTSASLLMADDDKWQGLLGENLAAQHYLKLGGVDVETFAQRFLDEWVKSEPHRENLAYPAYDRTGVGAAVNGDTVYVTELFASDLGVKPQGDSKNTVTGDPSPAEAQTGAAGTVSPPRGSEPSRP
jgi:uncharacterized protein YkwD